MSKRPNVILELLCMIKGRHLWWLAPIVVALLLLAVLMLAGGTPLAPFIYSLF